jgi:hypothetical protein
MKTMKPTGEEMEAVQQALGIQDPAWANLGAEIIKLLDETNRAYGNSTEKSAKILGILYPNGVHPAKLHDVRCMISILDKLSRIATDKDAFGESPWRDVAGYAILAYRHDLEEHKERES